MVVIWRRVVQTIRPGLSKSQPAKRSHGCPMRMWSLPLRLARTVGGWPPAVGDGTVRIVESSANKELLHVPRGKQFYQLGSKTFSAAAFSPDRHYVATADNAGVVRVTEIRHRQRAWECSNSVIRDVCSRLQSERKTVGDGGADKTVRLVDLASDHRDLGVGRTIGEGLCRAISATTDGL